MAPSCGLATRLPSGSSLVLRGPLAQFRGGIRVSPDAWGPDRVDSGWVINPHGRIPMNHVLRRPSPAMLVAMIALIAALSGSALAVTAAKNSVKSKSIKNGQVKTKDL